jgi:hypothetical protein
MLVHLNHFWSYQRISLLDISLLIYHYISLLHANFISWNFLLKIIIFFYNFHIEFVLYYFIFYNFESDFPHPTKNTFNLIIIMIIFFLFIVMNIHSYIFYFQIYLIMNLN